MDIKSDRRVEFGVSVTSDAAVSLYLDLLKRCVVNLIYQDPPIRYIGEDPDEGPIGSFSLDRRLAGNDWPSQAHTMIGMHRLDNIQALVDEILKAGTPGDLIETGVWRGGCTIFMRGILKAYGVTDRTVWAADSFGTPPRPGDQGAFSRSFTSPDLAEIRAGREGSSPPPAKLLQRFKLLLQGTKLDEVRERFDRYGLLDDQVQFLRGWFRDTLPSAPIERLALLRLDGDFYDSTYDALDALYPRLSDGGYVIVDDYNVYPECRQAVHDYLDKAGVAVDMKSIDNEAVYWQRRD